MVTKMAQFGNLSVYSAVYMRNYCSKSDAEYTFGNNFYLCTI